LVKKKRMMPALPCYKERGLKKEEKYIWYKRKKYII
jgi:hypothetical protein